MRITWIDIPVPVPCLLLKDLKLLQLPVVVGLTLVAKVMLRVWETKPDSRRKRIGIKNCTKLHSIKRNMKDWWGELREI